MSFVILRLPDYIIQAGVAKYLYPTGIVHKLSIFFKRVHDPFGVLHFVHPDSYRDDNRIVFYLQNQLVCFTVFYTFPN